MSDHSAEGALHHIFDEFEPLFDFSFEQTLLDVDSLSVRPLEPGDAILIIDVDVYY